MQEIKTPSNQTIVEVSNLAFKILVHEVEIMEKRGVEINTENWLTKRDSAISEACYIYDKVKSNLSDKK